MFWWSLVVFILTFNKLIIHSDAFSCPRGERVHEERRKKSCKPCPDRSYQPTENSSQKCKTCTSCFEGSYVKESCTKFSDAICQCKEGFVPRFGDTSECDCKPGSGIKDGVCSKCKEGYFSTKENTHCQKWNECKETGVKKLGNSTSDAVCNEESNSNLRITTPSTSIRKTEKLHTTRARLHEGNQTVNPTSTTSPPPQKDNVPPLSPSNNHTAVALFCLGIVGLLVWTAVICKMHVTPCSQKKRTQPRDSVCRRPVEESGDSSETSLKLNPEP